MKEKNVKIFKLIVLIVVILIMFFLTVKLLPIFKSISTEEGRLNFKNDIESLGGKGVLAIIRTYASSDFYTYSSSVNLLKF